MSQALSSPESIRSRVKYFTLAQFKVSKSIKLGELVVVTDRGNAFFKVVLASEYTTNEFNVVQCVGLYAAKIIHNGIITPEMYGVVGDGVVDDSAAINAIFDDTAVRRVNADALKTYLFSYLNLSRNKFTWDGGSFKFNRTGLETVTHNWNGWPVATAYSTGHEWLVKISKPALGRNGVLFKNITVDGNGVEYADSAAYPNTFVQMFFVKECDSVVFDNVHIKDNNGNGVLIAKSQSVQFINGSITNTRGITGSITSFEQIAIVASKNCAVIGNDFGGYTPWSCIATAGGWEDVVDGSEVGGFITFNSPNGFDNSYRWFGVECGTTDTFHHIANNKCHSDIVDPTQAGGGGVLGRVVTINSPRCFVKDNVIYDTTGRSQGGLGFGHEETAVSNPVFGRQGGRSEASGNSIFGFSKTGQGYGLLNNGSEDLNAHDNEIYNCNDAIAHTRYAATSRYKGNWIYYNNRSFSIGDFAGQAASHGIISLVKIHSNDCWDNLQDIVTNDNTTYADLSVKDNDFNQVRSNALIQFDVFHGLLDWIDNRIVNNSSNIVGEFFARGVGRHVDFNSTTIECLQDSSSDLFFFDGSFGDVIGRGSLTINDLKVDCPAGLLNRRFNIRRDNTKGVTINNPQMHNCKLVIQSKSGDVNIDGGMIDVQGATDECLSVLLADGTNPRMSQISNVHFPKCGALSPVYIAISGGGGHVIVNSCATKEDKEVTNKANSDVMRNNNCWKISSGVLTASRP